MHQRSLVLAAIVAISLTAGCSQPGPPAPGKTTVAPRAVDATAPAPSLDGCPPVDTTPGGAMIIDYVDFVVHGGVIYQVEMNGGKPVKPSQVGAEVFRVTCSFSDLNDRTHAELPPPTEHSSAFIDAGAPVHAVRGWSPQCRLTAKRDGTWRAYLANDPTSKVLRFKPCALGSGGTTAS